MEHLYITTRSQLSEFCGQIEEHEPIAFDTEFISEDCYQPDLCLVQVAAPRQMAIIDAYVISDLTPFWDLLTAPHRTTIAHGAREEVRFCIQYAGARPADLFDVQIAAGLVGLEYPAAYRTLADRLLGQPLKKGETRTDWRRRPLSSTQLEYALQDVVYLHELHAELAARLEALSRTAWLHEEMDRWQTSIEQAASSDRWRRLSGLAGLSPRALAVARQLWTWRDEEARQRNRPARRVLRDDLIVELARRQTADVNRIRALRGMERRELRSRLPALAQVIAQALELSQDDLPERVQKPMGPQFALLAQFLNTALGCICRRAQVSPGVVGSSQDVRDLITHLLQPELSTGAAPALTQGWRGEVVGRKIEEVMHGKYSLRVLDPLEEHPVVLEPIAPVE